MFRLQYIVLCAIDSWNSSMIDPLVCEFDKFNYPWTREFVVMNEKAKEILLPHVRKLIKCITNLEPGDDKYSHCEHLVFSNIRKDTYITVDRFAVRKSIDGIIKKFTIHSQLEEAEKLNELLDKFLSSKEFENNPQYDIQWYLLSLLLHLSYNPTSASFIKSHTIPVSSPVEEEDFDWTVYLLEGQQDVPYLNGGSETDDECYSSDELQEDGFSQSEVISKEELDLKNIQLGESNQASNVEDVMTKGILYSSLEREAKSAEEWLRENVQSPVVEDYKSRSRFASANFAEFWQSQQREKTDNSLPPKLMSEYRVLREILWTLQIPSCIPSYLQDVWKVSYLPDENGSYRMQQSITIPSLTKGAFKSIVDWFGCHVTLVGILEQFIAEIYSCKGQNLDYSEVVGESAVDPRECFPPHTYEAYASALKDFLSYFKEKVLFVEKKVKSQEYTCTLLSVRHDLEPVMKELRLVHGIHQKSICNWRRFRNWHCACRLLTMLYGALLSSLTDAGASICFKIFMKTFQPYLEIIHVWLTEGRLEDWRKEFIIAKNESVGGCHMNFWKEGFIVRPYEDVLLKKEGGLGEELHCGFPLGLLNLIEEKVLLLGKNMELLQHLNLLSEFQKSSPLFEGTLHSELLRKLECNLKIYLMEEDEQEESHPIEQVSCDCNSPKVDNARQNLIGGLANSDDYYLRETFEDIFLQTKESCSIHSKELSCQLNSRYHAKYKQPAVPVFLPIKPMLEHWLCELLDERHGMSCTVVRTVLLREFALTDHLLTVRRIFLMEAGDLVHHFCTHLFQQAEMREAWVDSSLTNYLQECISTRYSDAAPQFSIVLTPPPEPVLPQYSNNSNAPAAFGSEEMWLEKIDQINLIYSVEWPVNLVLNVTSMENYNTIFKFLLKVKWALWSLQQLRFSELTGNKTTNISNVEQDDCDTMPLSAKIHRLQLLRAWLLHFVGSVHSYLMGRVLHELGIKLEADLEAASDLDDIIHVHKKYLETVYQQCLQPKSSDLIKGAIMRVLEISMVLSTFWKQPSQLTSARLCEMENQYIRNHVFLASILSNAVQQGFVRHMETLSTALVHSFPSH